MRLIIGVLLSHWTRNRLQLVTLLCGIASATALWSGVQAINTEARASYNAAASTLGEGQYDQLLPRVSNSIPMSTFIKLRRNGWLVSPVTEGVIDQVRIVGIDPLTSPGGLPDLQANKDNGLQDFIGKDVLFANAETATKLDLPVTVQISANVAPDMAIADIGVVQKLLGVSHITRLLVSELQPVNQSNLADIAPELRLQLTQHSADVGEMTESFHLNLTAFGLLSFVVGIFIVHGAIGLAFEQRRGTIRTLRALGVSLNSLIATIAFEIVLLALLGAAIGILLGYLIAAALLPDVAATLQGLYGAEVSGTLQLRIEWWVSGFGIALLGTFLATANKLWQVAKMPILASANPRAWMTNFDRGHTLQLITVATLLALAGLLLFFGNGLVAGFLLLGCLLMGAALALPLLIDKGLIWFQTYSRSVIPQWFWADTRQQIPGLSLALMALLLAISANIGVSTMVSSFRLTFVEFLDQRLAPEMFVSIEDAEMSSTVEGALVEFSDEVLVLYSREGNIAGLPVRIDGIRVSQTYRENWRFVASVDDVWEKLTQGEVAISNEQFARRAGNWIGDVVALEGKSVPLAGIVADYGNPFGKITVGESLYNSLYPEDRALRFGARTLDPVELRQAVQSKTNLPDSAFINQEVLKSFSLQVFERTFAITAALNVLTLAVAGLAMLTSLLTLADLRVPQLAPVWAMGLTKSQLGVFEVVRTLVLAATVCVLALPLGLILAWVLLTVVNVEAFGWRLPMFLFPADYARLWLYSLIAAFLASIWPAVRLAMISPSALLKVFSHER
ncbi:MAG: ABC transporter permease [Pseudomonadota bacterium]